MYPAYTTPHSGSLIHSISTYHNACPHSTSFSCTQHPGQFNLYSFSFSSFTSARKPFSGPKFLPFLNELPSPARGILRAQIQNDAFDSENSSFSPTSGNGASSAVQLAEATYKPNEGLIEPIDLRMEMSKSYMEYAMSVILGRALPDARDGLKPVHRRILFAMQELKLHSDGPFRKCARVVGEVLGRYHPHGETAIYDSLVRLAQPFSMRVPLVDGHGNFGSTDGDAAAAQRYTECKLTSMAANVILADLDMNTVDFTPNFDGSTNEPLVLPTKVPNLLINGAAGIAVGMATNIPPHNLNEINQAVKLLLNNPQADDAELLAIVPAPDFPTGAYILNLSEARKLYLTGRGSITMRAKTHFETLKSTKSSTKEAIIVTELPYQENKSLLLQNIAEMVNTKKLEGISDLRDESDREGTRIVIELKKDSIPEIVLNNLFKKTSLQTNFAGNIVALKNGRLPTRFTLREALMDFIDFRRLVIKRRTQFEQKKASDRMHIVKGFLIAQKSISKIIKTIQGSMDPAEAKYQLIETYKLSDIQAESILSMPLRRLTSMERDKLNAEKDELQQTLDNLDKILKDPLLIDDIISKELDQSIKASGGDKAHARKSQILYHEDENIEDINLISNDQVIVVMTRQGFVKRMVTSQFQAQARGTRGKAGIGTLKEGDAIEHFFSCKNHDTILFFSQRGKAYSIHAFRIMEGSRTSRGTHISRIIPRLPIEERVMSVIPVSNFNQATFLLLMTVNGFVKKTALSAFETIMANGKIAISLAEGDELGWVRDCTSNDSIIIGSMNGMALHTRTDDENLRPTGRGSKGVKCMNLKPGDKIVDVDVIEAGEDVDPLLFLCTSSGSGKVTRASQFRKLSRRSQGIRAVRLKINSNNEKSKSQLVALRKCSLDEEVMIITEKGTILRQKLLGISMQSRTSLGVKIQKLKDDDSITAVTILPPSLLDDHDTFEDEKQLPQF